MAAAPVRVSVSGLRSVLAVLSCVPGVGEGDVAVAVERARRLLEPVLGPGLGCSYAWVESIGVAVVVFGDVGDSDLSRSVVAWGHVVGPAGPVTDGEVDRAIEDPKVHARELDGRFVFARVDAAGVTRVSSATTMHTLKRVDGPRGRCWATNALTALVLAGVTPELNEAAVPEFVMFDYVFGEDELLRGTTSLPDAHVVRIDRGGVHEETYWPREERLSAGGVASPQDLRKVLSDAVLPLGRHRDVVLGLTAGRDSTLLASVLATGNTPVDTFTLGKRWWSDPRGAIAVATRLGWRHDTVGSPTREADWERMVELSAWTEGMLTGADLADPIFDWDASDRVWLSGSGGEIGRMWYGSFHPDTDHWFATVRDRAATMSADAAATLADRLADQLDVARRLRPDDELDVLYITGRMAKWTARMPPGPHLRDVVAGYLHPTVVACLLDLPADERRSGQAFVTAQTLEGPDLHTIAVQGSRPPWPQRQLHRFRFTRLDQRATRRLAAHRAAVEPRSATRQILGPDWWNTTTNNLSIDPAARRHAWNALAVDALADAIA
jgi:hypothetical protein